jgi:hypothetical protein
MRCCFKRCSLLGHYAFALYFGESLLGGAERGADCTEARGIACGAFGPEGPSHFSLLAQRKVTQRNGLKSSWVMRVRSPDDYAMS